MNDEVQFSSIIASFSAFIYVLYKLLYESKFEGTIKIFGYIITIQKQTNEQIEDINNISNNNNINNEIELEINNV